MVRLKDLLPLIRVGAMVRIIICHRTADNVLLDLAPHDVFDLRPRWSLKDVRKEILYMKVIRINNGNVFQIYVTKDE